MDQTDESAVFAHACGAFGPVALRVERADGQLLAEGTLGQPFAVIGRDPACEITLSDPAVSLRHACLQAIGGRVLVSDLGSRTGVHGPVGGPGYAWLTPTGATRIGPFHLYLSIPVSATPIPLDRVPDPLHSSPGLVCRMPRAVLRFRNGRSDRAEWPVSRMLTFAGRSPACKISLSSDDVAPWHCYFLMTPGGLWVVDLLTATGTRVNGEAVRFARLGEADEVQVGRFRIGCEYPDGDPGVPADPPLTGFGSIRPRESVG